MSNGRRIRRVLARGSTTFVLPPIADDASPALKDALAIRNAASTTGRCQCGAEMVVTGSDEGIMHAFFEHEADCPASDDHIRLLSEQPDVSH